MSKIYRGEMQDNLGNTIYPHTEAGLVYCADGDTVQQKIAGTAETLDGITGVSDSVELDDSTKLATSKAVKTLRDTVNNSLGGLKFGTDGDGNYGYYGADGSLIPFSGALLFYSSNNGGRRNKKYISHIDTWSGYLTKGAKKTVQFAKKCNCIVWATNGVVTIDKGSVTPISTFTAGTYNPCPNYYVRADKGSTLTYTISEQGWGGYQAVLANFDTADFV